MIYEKINDQMKETKIVFSLTTTSYLFFMFCVERVNRNLWNILQKGVGQLDS